MASRILAIGSLRTQTIPLQPAVVMLVVCSDWAAEREQLVAAAGTGLSSGRDSEELKAARRAVAEAHGEVCRLSYLFLLHLLCCKSLLSCLTLGPGSASCFDPNMIWIRPSQTVQCSAHHDTLCRTTSIRHRLAWPRPSLLGYRCRSRGCAPHSRVRSAAALKL